jgi:hypothetical protein
LAKLDLGSGFKHDLPVTWVESVADDKVHLDRTADVAKTAWRERLCRRVGRRLNTVSALRL